MTNVRDWLPPELTRLARTWLRRGVRFTGDFPTWAAAEARSCGYEDQVILDRVAKATIMVRDGEAAFERDGVLFSRPDDPFPLLAGLLRAAAADGRLDVLDFGGALGSTYFQCRRWLRTLPSLRWRVVEQPHFVAYGSRELADSSLGFVDSVSGCGGSPGPNVAFISGVLQYLPRPREVLSAIADLGIRHIIIDRTPIIAGDRDILAVQSVPARIVRSSYPIRLFSRGSVLQPLEGDYQVVSEFRAVDGVLGGLRRRVEFRGFILEKAS